ncbi:MAG: glutamate mutase L [Deltaproteobacteria bacterium]|nr:glutamate mutase L [Deltaproteobacteria bacterium]
MNSDREYGLFIDFGSTFTKVLLVDLTSLQVAGRTQRPSTVDTDITIGLNAALRDIRDLLGRDVPYRYKLATSSAAGGLKMAALGLVPDLTVEAAKRAALGAGAKVVGVYAYRLSRKELQEIENASLDLILLAGGTDGGERETIISNADGLSRLKGLTTPIIVAGNKSAADEVSAVLESGNKEHVVTENVMPEIGVLEVDNVRAIIRELFISRIVEAKGLKNAEAFIDEILMPTPTAVLIAARLLAEGTDGEEGLGELVVLDIGGATTDVHSIAKGDPTEPGLVKKGLPETYVKRTVEGDLGMRYNASTIVQVAGEDLFMEGLENEEVDLQQTIGRFSADPGILPESEGEKALDVQLAGAAARLAVERHAGRIETTYGPTGPVYIQYGKDLRNVKTFIGTGGPLIFGPAPESILRGTLFAEENPFSLRPQNPNFYLDEKYLLYAVGLLSEKEPVAALKLGKKYLKKLDKSPVG